MADLGPPHRGGSEDGEEFMGMRIDNRKMESSPRTEKTLDQYAADPISNNTNPQCSKKISDDINIVGIDDDAKLIKDKLMEDQKKLNVASVVGMGELARLPSPPKYSMMLMLNLKDASDSRLRELVHKQLTGKRYLIVIDDIWHIEPWDSLKLFFPHGNNGSRILLPIVSLKLLSMQLHMD
ncbi:hypothetical protein E3N88_18786 [Mikania micrantha]|uniref:NB-ARC domain-containing protein n=1 Tax=Mikania micrantha TaxID=192012 RepID=A0A5N6NN24_9ASTR|nr:hypothetical protein E3N88_18786 [Mikania micrantha]